mmetsp:Transcript_44250/g.86565  ORF Transcript_44250/g.86565 Transcript_44250/m.86565 type:complete len:936 (+) Transcript_44250:47-2854(+)|eukprot:CAMPEP_0175145908 /NCGR_PEP_ID=MMETSP0087-20121206/15060_1 /TAXON_ID=136419 /ORGANISM="Unknown Unknown, Strain D1" /LENGTH=935 /DNA_ID=CAMNT_0016430763 /DNA_START=38 /DNA_END=2845 /DNA_ORIENTATION=-
MAEEETDVVGEMSRPGTSTMVSLGVDQRPFSSLSLNGEQVQDAMSNLVFADVNMKFDNVADVLKYLVTNVKQMKQKQDAFDSTAARMTSFDDTASRLTKLTENVSDEIEDSLKEYMVPVRQELKEFGIKIEESLSRVRTQDSKIQETMQNFEKSKQIQNAVSGMVSEVVGLKKTVEDRLTSMEKMVNTKVADMVAQVDQAISNATLMASQKPVLQQTETDDTSGGSAPASAVLVASSGIPNQAIQELRNEIENLRAEAKNQEREHNNEMIRTKLANQNLEAQMKTIREDLMKQNKDTSDSLLQNFGNYISQTQAAEMFVTSAQLKDIAEKAEFAHKKCLQFSDLTVGDGEDDDNPSHAKNIKNINSKLMRVDDRLDGLSQWTTNKIKSLNAFEDSKHFKDLVSSVEKLVEKNAELSDKVKVLAHVAGKKSDSGSGDRGGFDPDKVFLQLLSTSAEHHKTGQGRGTGLSTGPVQISEELEAKIERLESLQLKVDKLMDMDLAERMPLVERKLFAELTFLRSHVAAKADSSTMKLLFNKIDSRFKQISREFNQKLTSKHASPFGFLGGQEDKAESGHHEERSKAAKHKDRLFAFIEDKDERRELIDLLDNKASTAQLEHLETLMRSLHEQSLAAIEKQHFLHNRSISTQPSHTNGHSRKISQSSEFGRNASSTGHATPEPRSHQLENLTSSLIKVQASVAKKMDQDSMKGLVEQLATLESRLRHLERQGGDVSHNFASDHSEENLVSNPKVLLTQMQSMMLHHSTQLANHKHWIRVNAKDLMAIKEWVKVAQVSIKHLGTGGEGAPLQLMKNFEEEIERLKHSINDVTSKLEVAHSSDSTSGYGSRSALLGQSPSYVLHGNNVHNNHAIPKTSHAVSRTARSSRTSHDFGLTGRTIRFSQTARGVSKSGNWMGESPNATTNELPAISATIPTVASSN